MNNRAIIFDLDGTLTVSKSALTEEMGLLLAKLIEVVPVAVMSGGSYAQFQKQFLGGMPSNTDFTNLYLFPTCAAQCYTWKDGTWQSIYYLQLTPKEKEEILTALNESLQETGFDKPPAKLWGEQIEDRETQISWSALGQQAPYEEKKIWDPDRKKREPLQAALQKKLPNFSIKANATTTIDITRIGINKAYGVKKLSEILSVPISDMLYVGDALFPGGNDEVVKESGVPTKQVSGPDETAEIISNFLRQNA